MGAGAVRGTLAGAFKACCCATLGFFADWGASRFAGVLRLGGTSSCTHKGPDTGLQARRYDHVSSLMWFFSSASCLDTVHEDAARTSSLAAALSSLSLSLDASSPPMNSLPDSSPLSFIGTAASSSSSDSSMAFRLIRRFRGFFVCVPSPSEPCSKTSKRTSMKRCESEMPVYRCPHVCT